MSAGPHADYQVTLDTFRGPMDLLLYLVKRDEIDVRDIPIARVAAQFKDYLDVLTLIDVERAGEFLVLAATLMEIKSKLLLPQPEAPAAEEEDPRRELVRQLLEYKRFKEAAEALEALADAQGQRRPRAALPEPPARGGPPPLRPVELWDLVSAFGRLMRETLAHAPQTITVDHTPLHVHMEAVLSRLQQQRRLPFSDLFTAPHTRSRLVGLFLAILELAKGQRLIAEQDGPFAEIWLTLAEG